MERFRSGLKPVRTGPPGPSGTHSVRIASDPTALQAGLAQLLLAEIGPAKRLLLVGSPTHTVAEALRTADCDITGLFLSKAVLEQARLAFSRVEMADRDMVALPDWLPNADFDAVLYCEALEHFHEPWLVLESARRVLRDGGISVAALPNIAHGAIRLALAHGSLPEEGGPLAYRGFTFDGAVQTFTRAGYDVESIGRIEQPIFAATEVLSGRQRSEFPTMLVSQIEAGSETLTHHFVIRGRPVSEGSSAAATHKTGLAIPEGSQTHDPERQRIEIEALRGLLSDWAGRTAALERSLLGRANDIDDRQEYLESLENRAAAAESAIHEVSRRNESLERDLREAELAAAALRARIENELTPRIELLETSSVDIAAFQAKLDPPAEEAEEALRADLNAERVKQADIGSEVANPVSTSTQRARSLAGADAAIRQLDVRLSGAIFDNDIDAALASQIALLRSNTFELQQKLLLAQEVHRNLRAELAMDQIARAELTSRNSRLRGKIEEQQHSASLERVARIDLEKRVATLEVTLGDQQSRFLNLEASAAASLADAKAENLRLEQAWHDVCAELDAVRSQAERDQVELSDRALESQRLANSLETEHLRQGLAATERMLYESREQAEMLSAEVAALKSSSMQAIESRILLDLELEATRKAAMADKLVTRDYIEDLRGRGERLAEELRAEVDALRRREQTVREELGAALERDRALQEKLSATERRLLDEIRAHRASEDALESAERRLQEQTEDLIADAQAESAELATLVDTVQSSRFWKIKRWLSRFRRAQ
jgi:O-antigen biosynthesis protein